MPARNPPAEGRAWTPDKVRARIKTALIINALQDHILKDKEMNKSQVTAALGLLKKTLPDLQNIEASGPGGGAIPIQISSTDAEL